MEKLVHADRLAIAYYRTCENNPDYRRRALHKLTVPPDTQAHAAKDDFYDRFPGLSPENVQRALERLDNFTVKAEKIGHDIKEMVDATKTMLAQTSPKARQPARAKKMGSRDAN